MILLPLAGLILARSKLLPRGSASALATIGFVLLLLNSVAQLGFQIYLTRNSARNVIGIITVFGVAQRVLGLTALICLSCSIFTGRSRNRVTSADDDPR